MMAKDVQFYEALAAAAIGPGRQRLDRRRRQADACLRKSQSRPASTTSRPAKRWATCWSALGNYPWPRPTTPSSPTPPGPSTRCAPACWLGRRWWRRRNTPRPWPASTRCSTRKPRATRPRGREDRPPRWARPRLERRGKDRRSRQAGRRSHRQGRAGRRRSVCPGLQRPGQLLPGRRQGKPAIVAFLHVDLLVPAFPEQHAEALANLAKLFAAVNKARARRASPQHAEENIPTAPGPSSEVSERPTSSWRKWHRRTTLSNPSRRRRRRARPRAVERRRSNPT